MELPNDERGRQIGAFVLIALGVVFLLGTFGVGLAFNWWAIFIALPGIAMLRNVYAAYRSQEKLENNDFVQAFIGGFLVLLAASFLFGFDMDVLWRLWPLALIGLGLAMLFGYGRFQQMGQPKTKRDEEE